MSTDGEMEDIRSSHVGSSSQGGVELGPVVPITENLTNHATTSQGPVHDGVPTASSSSTPYTPGPSDLDPLDPLAPLPTTPQPPTSYPQPRTLPSEPQSPPTSSTSTSTNPSPPKPHPLPPPKTISSHLTKHPSHSAGKAISTVFPSPNPLVRLINRFKVKHSIIHGLSEKERSHWESRGAELRRRAGWKLGQGDGEEGVEVTPLFWQMYMSLLPTLQRDPLSGLVPPDLLGSTTTMPLSIISLIPDIMKHYRDVIIRAEKEIFLATNYWQPSNSVNTISQSLRDLSAKIVKEKRPKVIVKIMYDRGSWEQLWNAHAFVKKGEWKPLDLPGADEIPGLELEVINFHRVLLGTFHAKFLVVDRKVALINSNNIQDRPNLELMTHLEGPVVDAFYEIALHSWHNKLTPPLPCMSTPYVPPQSAGKTTYLFQDHNPYFDDIEILQAAKAARLLLRRQTKDINAEMEGRGDHHSRERFMDVVRKAVEQQRHSLANWTPGEELEMKAKEAMKELREFRERWGLGSRAGSRMGSRRTSQTELGTTHFQDDQTAAITAANTHLTLPTDPSSPDEPLRSRTYPQPTPKESHWDTLRDRLQLANIDTDTHPLTSHEKDITHHTEGSTNPSPQVYAQPDHHVMFASDLNLGGTGKFMDHDIVDSPLSSSIQIPPSATDSPTTPRPIMKIHLHADHDSKIQKENGIAVEQLPVSARMPDEIEKGVQLDEGINGKITENMENEKKIVIEEEVPEGKGSSRLYQMSKRFNATGVLSEAWATVEDSDDLDNFKPHVVHAPHDPFPIAMCCRKPHGFPGHHDIRNPQNAAWLAGFRYAKKKVFIQTPTLNARPIVRAIKQTCRRGVEVVLLLDLGFNDKGESIPFQGGTNEQVVDRLYKKLGSEGKEKHLKVYWYTGKDQVRPLNAVKKQRNCHIKFAAYDDQVLIIGNGNQDSQSWFHSQEVNVMIDSKQIVAEMMETLISNQNTTKYGLVDSDGVWRDEEGKTLVDYGATGGGKYQGLAGFIQFAKTI